MAADFVFSSSASRGESAPADDAPFHAEELPAKSLRSLLPCARCSGGILASDRTINKPIASLKLHTHFDDVSVFKIIATLGAPLETTAANLAIETFLPAR